MKTKHYRNGALTCKAYFKSAGSGFEVGFLFAGKPIFLSNFVRAAEAKRWWGMLNREVRAFSHRYKVAPGFPASHYKRFLSSHLYNKYFHYLDGLFAHHTRAAEKAVVREMKTFRRMASRRAHEMPRRAFLKAA